MKTLFLTNMKRRGFFSRLLGLAAIPFVPDITPKEKKTDMVALQDIDCPPGMVCINGKCAEESPYRVTYDPCCGDGVSYTLVTVFKKHGVNSFECIDREINQLVSLEKRIKDQFNN